MKKGDSGFSSKSLPHDALDTQLPTTAGWVGISFNDGTEVGISSEDLNHKDGAIIPSIALGMLPPRIPAVAEAKWNWRPNGWPEDLDLPEKGLEDVQDALNEWMSSRIPDNLIAEVCRRRILSSITSGFLSRNVWFTDEDGSGFLESLDGTELEEGVEGGS